MAVKEIWRPVVDGIFEAAQLPNTKSREIFFLELSIEGISIYGPSPELIKQHASVIKITERGFVTGLYVIIGEEEERKKTINAIATIPPEQRNGRHMKSMLENATSVSNIDMIHVEYDHTQSQQQLISIWAHKGTTSYAIAWRDDPTSKAYPDWGEYVPQRDVFDMHGAGSAFTQIDATLGDVRFITISTEPIR